MDLPEVFDIWPYDDNVEPLASTEEILHYEEAVAQEQQQEDELADRFSANLSQNSWYGTIIIKTGSAFVNTELQSVFAVCFLQVRMWQNPLNVYAVCACVRVRVESMYKRFVLHGICRFLRSVSYRQLVRLVWDFTGSSRHLPLPSCCYRAIRSTFPNPNDVPYSGFEEDDDV